MGNNQIRYIVSWRYNGIVHLSSYDSLELAQNQYNRLMSQGIEATITYKD